jgi:Pvc16 N-terminal domain
MSSPLAVGAVSAVLRNLLDNGFINAGAPLSPVKVTAVAPDTIKLDDPDQPPSLNLFLYRTSMNQGWAEMGLPAADGNGTRIANPPLALNLHYLLTAYGSSDFQAEILLGYAMHLLHERPVLDRPAIRRALDPTPLGPTILPPAFQALTASDLADQVEGVTITHEPMDTEEMSRLWSAIQAHYRPTASYLVSVVLIEARKPSRTALPVLSRGPVDRTGRDRGVVVEPSLLAPYPTIVRVAPDDLQPAARLGEQVRIEGHHLSGTSVVARFAHRLLDGPNEITVGVNADSTGIDLMLPAGSGAEQDWPAGVYTVSASLIRPDETDPRVTNVAAMLLAPEPVLAPPPAVARDATTRRVTVTMDVKPQVRPAQDAQLTLGGETGPVQPHPTATSTLTFELGDVPQGAQWVRLTVDGVESLLVDHSAEPPAFDPSQQVTVPA